MVLLMMFDTWEVWNEKENARFFFNNTAPPKVIFVNQYGDDALEITGW
jgi:hypothetical protein